MDPITHSFRVCPLLSDSGIGYECDSVKLSDPQSREYWLQCILDMLTNFKVQAQRSQPPEDDTAEQRATEFYDNTKQLIIQLAEEDYPKFSIRRLLDLIQTCLNRHGFEDPWREKKQLENARALQEFKGRLEEVDRITDVDAKWTELIKGVLAGNMFDWGAKAVSDILEGDVTFGLKNAMSRIYDRSWIFNGLPEFLSRIKQERPHTCAAIFVDNSGCDIVLGIMPFVRQLVLRRTKVILCANSQPALNDVTWTELRDLVQSCCNACDILAEAYAQKRLVIIANGQSGPCLDLEQLPNDLCTAMIAMGTDLIVLEGMGRAIHTNLYAKFNCEALKLAIVKNEWLARSLGGSLFSVVCKYELITD